MMRVGIVVALLLCIVVADDSHFMFPLVYPAPANLFDIAYSEEQQLFMGVGEFSAIITSPDAQLWSLMPAPAENTYRGNYRFIDSLAASFRIMSDSNSAYLQTTDGKSFEATPKAFPGGSASGNGLYAGVADDLIYRSRDGEQWTKMTSFTLDDDNVAVEDVCGIAFGDDTFVVISTTENVLAAYVSKNLTNWERYPLDANMQKLFCASLSSEESGTRSLISYISSTKSFALVGEGIVLSSDKGKTWELVHEQTAVDPLLVKIKCCTNRCVALAEDSEAMLESSDGGASWTYSRVLHLAANSLLSIQGLACSAEDTFAYVSPVLGVLQSTEALKWKQSSNQFKEKFYFTLSEPARTYDQEERAARVVSFSSYGTGASHMWESTDGENFELNPDFAADSGILQQVVYGNNHYLAISDKLGLVESNSPSLDSWNQLQIGGCDKDKLRIDNVVIAMNGSQPIYFASSVCSSSSRTIILFSEKGSTEWHEWYPAFPSTIAEDDALQSVVWSGSHFVATVPARSSILHSFDGRTWYVSAAGIDCASVATDGDSVVIALCTCGILRSTDGGMTWRAGPSSIKAIGTSNSMSNLVYLGHYSAFMAVGINGMPAVAAISYDFGATFALVHTDFAFPLAPFGVGESPYAIVMVANGQLMTNTTALLSSPLSDVGMDVCSPTVLSSSDLESSHFFDNKVWYGVLIGAGAVIVLLVFVLIIIGIIALIIKKKRDSAEMGYGLVDQEEIW